MTYRYSSPPSQRQLRIAESIRHALAKIITMGELNHPFFESHMISVSEVRISPDLKIATAFMIFPDKVEEKTLLNLFKELAPMLRKMVADKLKLRYAPEIHFAIDESIKNAAKLEDALSKIKN